ncbi:MAG: substrate-binding domain-containing protein [Novosphingobium sp.]
MDAAPPLRTGLSQSRNVLKVRTLGTASRALSESPLVNARTRERIRTLARDHGFQPNRIASNLRSRRTGTIGVVIPLRHERRQHISDPFFMTLLGYLADELTESGYNLMLSRAVPDDAPDWLDRIAGSGMVDGVIVIGQSDQFETIERVAKDYPPLVVWGSSRPGQVHCAVGTDNGTAGRMAAERLLAGGSTRLAFLGETTGMEIADRFAGVRDAVEHTEASCLHLPCPISLDPMAEELETRLIEHAGWIDGIVAASDLIAMSALKVLDSLGKNVPGDVQIIGFDDLQFAAQTVPPLTTIRQDIAGSARAIITRLKAAIGGNSPDSLITNPVLIERETTR